MAETPSPRPVFFFDIDNCLYSRSKKVHDLMQELIDAYFITNLSLSEEDATMLHQKYYKEYGLAIEGLVRHHKVDPLEYNRQVDDALPLDTVLHPDPQLRKILEDIDNTKVKLWLFTNAHVTHGMRVVKLLGVEDLFEGITYCDYTQETMICKPHDKMFDKAEAEAEVSSVENCFFVDDSHLNCRHAQARGWTAVHLLEPDDSEPATKASKYQIRSLTELRVLFPHFFTSSANRLPDPVEQNLARKNSIQQQAISLYTSQQSRPRQIPGRSESSAPQQAIPRNVSPQSRSKQTAAEFDNGDSSDEKTPPRASIESQIASIKAHIAALREPLNRGPSGNLANPAD
ncbi:hypothetical protein MMC12_005245 [Toensbergia leucococca]|nr:hypothetical protein [Toensbergia leucococca]